MKFSPHSRECSSLKVTNLLTSSGPDARSTVDTGPVGYASSSPVGKTKINTVINLKMTVIVLPSPKSAYRGDSKFWFWPKPTLDEVCSQQGEGWEGGWGVQLFLVKLGVPVEWHVFIQDCSNPEGHTLQQKTQGFKETQGRRMIFSATRLYLRSSKPRTSTHRIRHKLRVFEQA